jgi:hypothetical protein
LYTKRSRKWEIVFRERSALAVKGWEESSCRAWSEMAGW